LSQQRKKQKTEKKIKREKLMKFYRMNKNTKNHKPAMSNLSFHTKLIIIAYPLILEIFENLR
jgi:hypothetical protein